MIQRQLVGLLMAVFTVSTPLFAEEKPEPAPRVLEPLRPSQPQEWQEIGQYQSWGKFWEPNPLLRIAEEYFNLYLTERPSVHAADALKQALNMWSYAEGGSLKIREALEKVPPDEDLEVWRTASFAVYRSFLFDQITHEGDALLEQLSQTVQSQEAQEVILGVLADLRFQVGQTEQARKVLEQLVELPAHTTNISWQQWMLRQVVNHPIGSPAPDFEVTDIDGNAVSLSSLRGRVVVLYFWGTWCGWCKPGYPYLRALADHFDKKDLAIVGISYEDSEAKLRATIDQEGFNWINISESERSNTITALYDIAAYPTVFVLDREGKFAAHNPHRMGLYRIVSQLLRR